MRSSHGVALHDYFSDDVVDLTILRGDVVKLLEILNGDWYLGELDGRHGLVPTWIIQTDGFDDEEDKEPTIEQVDGNWFRGCYDGKQGTFSAKHVAVMVSIPEVSAPSSLDNKKQLMENEHCSDKFHESPNDNIVLQNTISCIAESSTNFEWAVSDKEERPTNSSANEVNISVFNPHCIALYDFLSDLSEDLQFHEGDIIELKAHINEEWLQGRCNNREGAFPKNFVRIINDIPKLMRCAPPVPSSNKSTIVPTLKKSIAVDSGSENEQSILERLDDQLEEILAATSDAMFM